MVYDGLNMPGARNTQGKMWRHATFWPEPKRMAPLPLPAQSGAGFTLFRGRFFLFGAKWAQQNPRQPFDNARSGFLDKVDF